MIMSKKATVSGLRALHRRKSLILNHIEFNGVEEYSIRHGDRTRRGLAVAGQEAQAERE